MNSLPNKDFKPEEIDEVVKSFGKSLAPERKKSLMAKLEKERGRFEEHEKERSEERPHDNDRER